MKILSVSDVITNSSSEVFVIHAKPEFQDEINKIVPELLTNICNVVDLNIDGIMFFEIAQKDEIDEDWYYHTSKNDLIIHSSYENSIPSWLMEFIQDLYWFPKLENKFYGYYAKDLGVIDMPYIDWNDPYEERLKTRPKEIESIQREHLG